MARASRLFDLLQSLRRHRRPVRGQALADELGVSLRTLYRDIATLQAQGAHIEGEPGLGYVLRPDFMLPPLMFSGDEIQALVLGTRWVAQRGDDTLGLAARDALAKIAAVLPVELRNELDDSALLVGPGKPTASERVGLGTLREAIRSERKLSLVYSDGNGNGSERIVWPFALGFFDQVRMLVAWCELRQGFRHFRIDRVLEVTPLEVRYPRRRQALLKAWRAIEGIPVA